MLVAASMFVFGCGDGARSNDGGSDDDAVSYTCPPPAPTSCPSPAPHYPDIAPIIERRCVVCHSGSMEEVWPLTDYKHLADWQDIIRDAMLACTMPPADAGFQMTTAERVAILTWVRCGFLE